MENQTPERGPSRRSTGKLKRPEADLFVGRRSGGTWHAYRPEVRIRLRSGRSTGPDQEEPDLFAVEQVSENTHFFAELRGDLSALQAVSAALSPIIAGQRFLRLGRGGTPVEVRAAGWSRTPSPPTKVPEQAYLILTSDLLVRDEALRFRTALTGEAADLAQVPGWPAGVTLTPLFQEETEIRGFNGTSRLWRMPQAGIRRGSVYRVQGPGLPALYRESLTGNGLGERTHEGFGRFRLDEVLPGCTQAEPEGIAVVSDADGRLEAIAEYTLGWAKQYPKLASRDEGEERRPSLGQWRDLATELHGEKEGRDSPAIAQRLQPTTAGAAGFRHVDARSVLNELQTIRKRQARGEEAALHVDYLVRWLRVRPAKAVGT